MKNTISISNFSKCKIATLAVLTVMYSTSQARVTEIDVQSVQPANNNFEQISGVAYGEVDPNSVLNGVVTDIHNAPVNANGNVEYSTEFRILKPLNNNSGVLLYDVVNRGGGVSEVVMGPFMFGVPSVATDRNYMTVWSGWQGDLKSTTPFLNINVPVATDNGETITGDVRTEYTVTAPTSTVELSSGPFSATKHVSYAPVSLDTSEAVLTKRVLESDARVEIPASDWAFADCATTAFPGVVDATKVCLKDGFDTNYIYELVYEAKDPLVLGLGLAATRDLVSFLHHSTEDDHGNPNPVAGLTEATIAHGTSQSGRMLRTFIDLGFNEDEEGRMVFDGVNPHIATGRAPINVRFGQPGRGYGQHSDHLFPSYESPYTWARSHDGVKGETAGLLDRCRASDTCPKIMWTVSATEYWQGRASLNTTDAEGKHDVGIPEDVRMYMFSSTQHFAFPGLPASQPVNCQLLSNPNSYIPNLRALMVAFEEWVTEGREPPQNVIPRIRDNTLVAPVQSEMGFPSIPGVMFNGAINHLGLIEYGDHYDERSGSGIITETPIEIASADYTLLVPRVDADGNDVAGIKSPDSMAPLGTYVGWNLRKAGFSEGELCGLTGGYVPFAATEAERLATGDPRLSLEARYGDHAGYVEAVTDAANQLVGQRLLLPSDAQRYIDRAVQSSVLK